MAFYCATAMKSAVLGFTFLSVRPSDKLVRKNILPTLIPYKM